MGTLKISMDEWAVIDCNAVGVDVGFTLWTDGLSGCVGVAIAAGSRAFVTHISSDFGESNKADYLELLGAALSKIGPPGDVSKVLVALGGDSSTEVWRGNRVVDRILEWVGADVSDQILGEAETPYSGVTAQVTGSPGRWTLGLQRNLGTPPGTQAPHFNSQSGAHLLVEYGHLPNFTGPA